MADTFLRRSQVPLPLESLRSVDFNRTNNSAFSNLMLLARHAIGGLASSTGVIRGLRLIPSTTPMLVNITTGCAVSGAGLIIIESPRPIGPFAANNSGVTRYDLVSIAYQEAPATVESRVFKQGTLRVESPVPTEVVANPVVVITPGTPAAPATPVGNVAVGVVAVPSGGPITFTSANINNLGLSYGAYAGDSNIPIPYATPPILSVTLDENSAALLIGTITVLLGASFVGNRSMIASFKRVDNNIAESPTVAQFLPPILDIDPADRIASYTLSNIILGPKNNVQYKIALDLARPVAVDHTGMIVNQIVAAAIPLTGGVR